MTDPEIRALLRSGQTEQAFTELVNLYSEPLYRHVRSLVGSHEDTDDLLQDIFIKVWKALPAFRGESQLFTWLWRIATNEALSFRRKAAVREALRFESLDARAERIVDADPWFDGDEAQRKLAKAIAALPDKQRAVFNMRYFQNLSFEEIALITGTSVGALKASYHFAAEKIRKKVSLED